MIDQDGMRQEERTDLRPELFGPGTDTVPVSSQKRPWVWQQSDSAWSDWLCRQCGKRRRSTLKMAAPAQIEIVYGVHAFTKGVACQAYTLFWCITMKLAILLPLCCNDDGLEYLR